VKNLTLITGGVRSGKSRLAETLANASGSQVYYLATMPRILGDNEQDERIDRHRRRRPENWQTIECPYDLTDAIDTLPRSGGCALIDCLSLFVSNLILNQRSSKDPYACEDVIAVSVDDVLKAIDKRTDYQFIVVTNEVGWGVVPDNPLGRAFRDFLGIANQQFAEQSDTVWLTCAGLPLRLKPDPLLAVSPQPACPASA
jgi:adenosylcobinamide kinase / adenosylcobinamide-phosphate guanylyltransferase